MFIHWSGFAQNKTVSGTVKDGTGVGLPGVSILIKGTTRGTTSDVNGKFSIPIDDSESILSFSFIGFKSKELPVGSQSNLEIVMEEDAATLEEVVVIGYGEAKKGDVTGSVAQLRGNQLNRTPSSSMDQLLQGKIAGVQVVTSSGQPGAGATIRIRGVSSLNGQQSPLVVVDGFPMGDAGNLKQINPEDIESIEVLKDASSAAIYGSRGANGVIMVTTKKARAGVPRITFSSLNTISTLAIKPDVWRDATEEAIYANEAALNGGTPANQLPYLGEERGGVYYPSIAELRGLDPNNPKWPYNTDWVKKVYRKPFSQSYTLSVDGGSEDTKYSVSGNYYKEEGLAIKNYYDRYNGRFNLNQKISKSISAGTNIFLTYTKNNGQQLGAGRSRIFPVYDSTGNYFRLNNLDFGNPIAVANEVLNTTRTTDILATIFANVKITDWLQFRTQLSTKYGNSVQDVYEPRTVTFRGYENVGFGAIYNYNNNELLSENYLTINKELGTDHKINVVGGFSVQKYYTKWSNLTAGNFPNDNLKNENLNSAQKQIVNNPPVESPRLDSWYGRANYTFKDRYLFTFTGRADGSTKFGANNKWAFFPSGAIAWKVNEESFMSSSETFSDLKLRASYGLSGNQGLPPYRSLERFGTGRYFTGSGFETGFGPGLPGTPNQQNIRLTGGLGNKSLKWETTNTLDIGMDLGLFSQRITVTADYYVKKTKDLLRIRSVAPSAGYDEQWVNDGTLENRGFELGVNANVVSKGDFEWNVGGIYSMNRNKVTAMGESNLVQTGDYIEMLRQNINYFIVGQPVNAFYGFKTDGIIQTTEEGQTAGLTGGEALPGEIKYVDREKDGDVDSDDRTVIGNPNPDFIYSFNTNVKYKGFDLTAQLYGVQGNDVLDLQKMTPSRQVMRWTADNPSNEYPRANNTRGYRASDFFVTDGSFLRIQNVTIGYSIPQGKIKGVKSIRIYLSGNNLYTFTKFNHGFDPEVATNGINYGGYPRPRAYSLGLNVGF
jgi:TonB-linked SusC/RagA family outer membrane protein